MSNNQRKRTTTVSPWKNKEELEETFNEIYGENSTIKTKENALNRLKIWKIRNTTGLFPSILCTSAVLEAQIHDHNSNDGENINELRNMYSGAFTKFINFIAESPGTGALKKGSMKQKVENIGIESFIVDLRHLCAHTSVTISIDVFRRSAEYSMNWLKSYFWEPEMADSHNVDIKRIRLTDYNDSLNENLNYVLKMYDILTKAMHRGSREISDSTNLSPSEVNLVKEHFKVNPAENLHYAVRQLVRFALDNSGNDLKLLCKSIVENCPYMFECTDKANFVDCHQFFIQYLTGIGCIQLFFETLVEISEDGREKKERRAGCSFWAIQIVNAFKNLKKFKLFYKDNSSCSSFFTAKEYTKPLSLNCKKNYFNAMRVDARESLIIGATVDCPWHLSFSKAYVTERLKSVNEYTKDIVDVILTLVEPRLKADKRRELSQIMDIYTGQKSQAKKETNQIYTLADLKEIQKNNSILWSEIPLGAVMDKIM